jgi:hypothetical protein
VKTAIPLRADCSQIALDERANGSWVIMFLGVESVAEDCARGTCQACTGYAVLSTEVLLEQELLGTPLSSGRM